MWYEIDFLTHFFTMGSWRELASQDLHTFVLIKIVLFISINVNCKQRKKTEINGGALSFLPNTKIECIQKLFIAYFTLSPHWLQKNFELGLSAISCMQCKKNIPMSNYTKFKN